MGGEAVVTFWVFPVEPSFGTVEAVAVVVAVLGVEAFVAGEDHRGAGCEEEESEHVPSLAEADLLDLGGGWTFGAVVGGVIEVDAVVVVLAVGEIVFLFVGETVAKGEAIVSGDEVDRVRSGAAEERGDFSGVAFVPVDETAEGVAEVIGPSAGLIGQVAGDVVAGCVPGFEDVFTIAEDGVGHNISTH